MGYHGAWLRSRQQAALLGILQRLGGGASDGGRGDEEEGSSEGEYGSCARLLGESKVRLKERVEGGAGETLHVCPR